MNRSLKRTVTVGALALGASTLAAPTALAAEAAPTANVRVAHLVPGLGSMQVGVLAGSVDPVGVTADETVVETGVGYGDVGSYAALPAGTYTVTIRDPASTATAPLLEGELVVEAGHSYTVSALGTTSDASIRALDDDPRVSDPGTSRVRLVNATASGDDVTVSADGGPVLAEDLAFAEPTGYAVVPARDWSLSVDPGNETSVELASGASYTVLLLTAGGGTEAKAVLDAAPASAAPSEPIQAGLGGAATEFTDEGWFGPRDAASTAVLAVGAAVAVGGFTLVGLGRRRSSSGA